MAHPESKDFELLVKKRQEDNHVLPCREVEHAYTVQDAVRKIGDRLGNKLVEILAVRHPYLAEPPNVMASLVAKEFKKNPNEVNLVKLLQFVRWKQFDDDYLQAYNGVEDPLNTWVAEVEDLTVIWEGNQIEVDIDSEPYVFEVEDKLKDRRAEEQKKRNARKEKPGPNELLHVKDWAKTTPSAPRHWPEKLTAAHRLVRWDDLDQKLMEQGVGREHVEVHVGHLEFCRTFLAVAWVTSPERDWITFWDAEGYLIGYNLTPEETE